MIELMAIVYWIIVGLLFGTMMSGAIGWDDGEHIKSPMMRDLLIIFVIFAWFIALPIGIANNLLREK